MKVQNRLSLFSSIVFGIIFAVISLLIYALYSQNMEKSIYNNLKKTSFITAFFYLEEDELNNEDFDRIRKQFDEFVTNSYYQIFDEHDSIYAGSKTLTVSPDYLNKIRETGSLAFSDNNFFSYGIYYEDNQGNFVIITRERKDFFNQQLDTLLRILIIAFIAGIFAIVFLSKWIANIALKKISETLIMQKNFVNYVSHEFKTPLTTMLGNLEVFSIKNRTPEEYKELSGKLIQQINQLGEILSTLMVISDLRNNSDITNQVRIDELIWEIVNKINEQYTDAHISVNIDLLPDDENSLIVSMDKTQLLIALFNLTENAVKYSQGKFVKINIGHLNNRLCLSIADKGIGIPPEELKHVSKPFYRADNTNQIQGSGIGLSIALRIFEKNKIEYNIESTINKGTTVFLLF